MLIFLDDVTPSRGPFRYVPGTHRSADTFELAIRKANMKAKVQPVEFMSLPEEWQLHADFGPYMDPADPLSIQMLEREVSFEGVDFVVFDYHGAHRGGFVREGARTMIQCTFEAARSDAPKSWTMG